MKDREQNLLTKQIRALNEDNERILAMYKMIQQTPPKTTGADAEVIVGSYNSEFAQTKKKGNGADDKGWKVAKDNFGIASFGRGSPAGPLST